MVLVDQFAACTEQAASKRGVGVDRQSVGHKLQKCPQVHVMRQPPASGFHLLLEPLPLRESLSECVQKQVCSIHSSPA